MSISSHHHQYLLLFFWWLFFFLIETILSVQQCLIVVLICISLMIHDVECLFMWVWAICVFSLKKCLFKSLIHFWIVVLLWSFRSSLYILNVKPHEMRDLRTLSPILLFVALLCIESWCSGVLHFHEFHSVSFSFYCLCFWSHFKEMLPSSMLWKLCPMLSSKSHGVRA